ncbi:MAG: hypothetical protein JWR69_4240 [Pedosphaera sp.]|nr:hypothetical protein [Pedosphaera sp.]
MEAKQILVKVKSDDKSLEKNCDLPTDCLPAVNDRVTLHGSPYACIGREVQIEDGGVLVVTIHLRTVPA